MEQDDRSQKLLAGKEKLAAFQRKRAKRKKKKEADDGASEYTWSETSSLADLSDVASTGDFSDTGSVVDDENDWSRPVSRPQVSQSVALVRAQNDVRKMTSRITELEEMLHGKQEAMSRLMEENKQLQASQTLPTQSTADLPVSAPGSLDDQGGSTDDRETDDQNADESYQHKLDEFEEALKKRDEVIAQLTENLRATTVSRDTLQQEYTAQASELARQVQTLQMQLKQSGECLKNQMGEHGISAHALLEAKNELLALQQANSHQEQDLTAARAAISERDQALYKLIEQYKAAAEQANLIHQEYGRLQQQNVQSAQLIEQLTHAREEAHSEKLATLQQCQELQNKAADADLQSQQLSQQLKDNQLRIQTLETALNEGNVEICRLKEVVEQKDESLKQMVQSLTSVSNDQDADKILRDTVDRQQNEISSLKEAVHHKDQKLHQLNEKFFETSEQLKTLYTEVAALKEKEKEVTILRQAIREREETVSTLQNNIQAKEQNLLDLQQSFLGQQNGNKEDFSEVINENTVADLKEQLIEKDKLLQDVSERFRALAEKSGKLEEDSAKVLLVKLQQLTQDNATLLEENKQLKETENEINEIAAKIPQLSHEIQRLGGENRELKQKENEMYQLIEDMKKREQIVDTLNNEKQQLTAVEEALQKENQDLKDKLISLQNVKENLDEIQSKYSELQQKIDNLETERNTLKDSADVLKEENVLLKEKSESLSAEVADIEQLKLERAGLLQRTEAADKDRETTAVKLTDLQDAHDKIILEAEKKDEEKKMLASQVAELEQELKTIKLDVEAHQRSAADRTESEVIQQQAESLREIVKEKEAALDNLTETVTKLTADVKSLSNENQRLIEQNGQIEQLQVELESSNAELSNLRASLEQKEVMLEDTRNAVNNLEMQVSVLNDENKEMKEKQNELRHLKDLVAAKEKEIIDLGKSISEKDLMMDEMSVVIDDFKKTSARLESAIAEKEKATEELQDALNENKNNLANLTSEVKEATEKINQLQVENKGLQEQIETEKVKMLDASEKENVISGLKESLQLKQVELESLQNKLSQSELDKAELEAASASLNGQLTDLRQQVDELNHNNQDLMSCKEDLNGKLEETIKEKQANLAELEEKVGSLTEELDRAQAEYKDLQNEAKENEVQMAALKKDLSDYETKVQKYETDNALLQEKVESLIENTEKVQEKEDLLVKTEGEVTILKETLKERDDRLMELTDNMTKLTQDVSQLTGMNHVLQVREDELIEAQRNVQQHIDAVNEQIETLKAENQTLATKEQQLLETQAQLSNSEALLAEANEKFATLQQVYDTMKTTHGEEEFVALKEEVNKSVLNMGQLSEENNELRSEIETHKQRNQPAEEQENIIAPVKAQNVSATQQTVPDHNEVSSSVDLSTHEDDLVTKATLAETQMQLEKLHAENQELKKSLDGLLSSQRLDLAVSQIASGDSQSDMQNAASVGEKIIVAQTVPLDESPPDLATALEETDLDVPIDRSEEADLLRIALGHKEEEARVLQSSIHTQHAALQQMHKQLTEVTQYVTYLGHENQALKAKLSPEMQEAANPTTNTQSDTQTQLQVPKVDSAQIEDLSEKPSEKSTVEMLQSEIDQQREALDDMSERYSKLVEENHALKLEISKKSDKVEPPTVSSVNTTEQSDTTAEVPENKEVVALHAYIQQQNAHMEQMSQRMNEMAQYVNQVQEQNKLLQEKDVINGKALETQAQASEETEKQRKQLEEQLQKGTELKDSLESNSASLAKLDQENKLLKQKEKESTEVVQQLMKDIEEIRRSRSQSPSHSDVVTLGGSVSAAEHERALAALRAELEEQHGEQIVEMKQQYREQIMSNMNEQIKELTNQRDDALKQLSIKEKSSSEAVESLNSVIQQCELKLKNMEEEKADYLLNLQEQQDRFSVELAAVGKERDSTKALLAEYESRKEKIASEFEQFKEEQAKEVDLLKQRLTQVLSERDQALADIEKLKMEEPIEGSSQEESSTVSSAREQHVEEMAKQLQDLARERDEALAKIQAQEHSLNQPLQEHQHNIQSQVVDALKTEIDALNSQLNDVTSAKEEALTHVEKLQEAINRQAEEPSGSSQQASQQKSKVQTTPVRRKVSPQQKPLSPMQQQLLHLQQQLLQESPQASEDVQQEAAAEDTSPPATVSTPAPHANTEQQSADKTDLQLKQMQEIYDQHCQLQAHQIEQLTAELARVGREREELMSQLEQYQKHYDSHVQNLVEQGKKEAADKVKAIHEELNEAKKERDMVIEKFEALQSQTKSQIRELTEQVAGWKGKYHEMSQNFTGDSAVVLARVQAETSSLQSQLDDLQAKLEGSEKERDDAKAQAKELKIAYYDLEGKDPNVAGYRHKLEDIEATLKVTWIENEELKVEVASLKSKLQKEDGTAAKAETDNEVVEDVDSLKVRLLSAEAEVDRLQPLVGVEVIVLMRQMEDLRSTFSHQLRVHAQELTAVKCELARYQSLDSDSSESPVRMYTQLSPDKKGLEKPSSVDSTNIELGRAHAEHQLEVESLKKSKGEFALELNAEKERHRDAMARIEQLLKEMVNMQQKHKEEMEAVRKDHEETVHQMSVHMEEMKLQQMVNTNTGADDVSEMKVHFDTIINEKQRLLTERDQLLQEKGDWDAERDRLKGRIAQVVGEKDLIAKERDTIRNSIQKVEQDQNELRTQQRLVEAEKQQLMFEREQVNFFKEQSNQGSAGTPPSDNDQIKSLQAELAALKKYKDQVSLLQQERSLLVDDHVLETKTLTAANSELKQRLEQAESEKQLELEELRERMAFDINELQVKLEMMEQEQPSSHQQELSSLRAENEQLIKEYSTRAVTQIAEWKLQREDMEKEFEVKLESHTKELEEQFSSEISDLKRNLRDAAQELEQVKKERDAVKAEHTDVVEALRAQENELVKLQTACSHLKEERDVLQSEYSGMLTSLQQEAADSRIPHLTSQVQHLTAQRQAMQNEHALALSTLKDEYDSDRARLQHLIDEAKTKHTEDLHTCTSSHEAELEVYKQKHAEVLDEVHTLRRENYEMRTVVSDPRTQQNMTEVVACTTQTLTMSPPGVQPDSLSPDTTTASEEERDFHKIKDDYQSKLKALEDEHEKELQDKEASLQERCELSQRQLKVEYQWDLQEQTKKLKEEAARETDRQLKVARIENERKFVTELQAARREISGRYESQLEMLRQRYEQEDLHQATLTTDQLQDMVSRLQIENKDLAETRDALIQQIDKAHGHQEELQEEVTAVSTQKDALSAENLQLQHRLTQLQHNTMHTEPNWRPLPDSTVSFTKPPPDKTDSTDHQQLLEKYSMLLGENQKLQQRLAEQQPKSKSPSIPDSLEGSLEPPDLMMRLQDQIRGLQKENDDLRSHLDDQNLVAHEELGELQGKYIQLVAENESLRANLDKYEPHDLLDEDIDLTVAERRETDRLQSCYSTLAQENEVLRAKLGSYGLPTESAAEEENLDLASRYELIRKENEGLRAKLQAYTHQGALERDGRWKEKYDTILRDYAILRSQLEELGLPINDSIQKGLEELQVKFDQVVKEKETLQVKLTTVRENAEQDFRELQARHSELHATNTALSKEHADLKALLEKDKDKSKREYLKTKSKLLNTSKELEALRSKFEKATKDSNALKSKLDQAEARLKQEASSSAAGNAGKGKKRKQERGNHSKGRKQRRESEAQDDSVEMADQTIQEELDSLNNQYMSVVKENDALKSEVGGLKCELGSLKSRLMDSLRHRLRDPPVAHSTPLDSDFTHSQGNQDGLASTPTGRPMAGRGQQAERSSSTSDLNLSSPEDVEALRQQHEAALEELGRLRNELDRMNSKALDELMGLQSEADALEEENASMKQTLKTDGADNTDPSSLVDVPDAAHHTQTNVQLQQQLSTIREQLDKVKSENEELRQIIGNAAGTSKQGNVKKHSSLSKNRGNDSNLTHRNVHSESEIHPVKENTEMAAVSDQVLQKQKSKRTVSLDSVGVEVPVPDFSVEVKQPPLYEESHGMNTVIPSSGLEGGQLEAEWKRIVRMRNRAASAGDAVAEEGFHPEVDRHALSGNRTGAFIPDSPNMETQLVWPSTRADSGELPLMSIEDEFKLQLESMVANFGEQDVREQLGRDYIEIHQKYEAIREENDKLNAEVTKKSEEVKALERNIDELEEKRDKGDEVFFSGDPGDGADEVRQLRQELAQLRDENQLLLQENTTLEAQCESQNAKSAWQKTVIKGDLESELEHLRSDRDKLEDEMGKIKSLYSTVKEHSEKLSVENEELNGDKVRLERELQVLRSVLEALRQEQVKVEDEIKDRVGEQAARGEGVESSQESRNTLSAQPVSSQKKARKKSPGRLHASDGQQPCKSGKRGKKSASPEPEAARKSASHSSPAPGMDSPMKAVKEPPTKVKKVAQSHSQSRESLVFEDKVGMSQLKQKLKELTAKNKTMQSEVDALKKQLAAADRKKDIQKLQEDNKALLRELEEMRGSLKSQHKLSEQIQDLRARIEALVKEKDTLKKENQALSDRINDGVSPPMMEFEELKVQNQQLVTANRSLTEKLDRDLMQAEHELAEMRDKHKLAQAQKVEIEDEYKNFRDRVERELYGLQARYDEVVEERDFLETQLINNREHAEKDYQQLQAGYEEMRNEYEELQRAYDNDKEKARKEISEIKMKIESVKQDNEELKREIQGMTEDGARGKSGLQQQCAMLQEEKHNLSREIKEYQNRLTTVEKAKEEVDKQLREVKSHYENLKKYHEEEKIAAEEESELSKTKYESLKADYDRLSETLEELKMEKNNLLHELNDSHAWCETLEMNLKETESSMHKETVTLKEELQFISEKLENETSVRNSLASAEEELRQKLIDTSQELDKAKREAQATKEKHTAKLDNLHRENSDLTTQIGTLQIKLNEKQLEVESSNTEISSVRQSYSEIMKSYDELNQIKEAMENEYRQMRNKFGVTESELQEFRKSYFTENMESGKLMSRFRVQFEQVTEERDHLKGDLKHLNQQLEEIKAKHLVQVEDNRALRSAIGAEVDSSFQTVTQIESMLGDDKPPISPVSPLCRSPAMSDNSIDVSGEIGPSSGTLINKLHKQNTSLALLIQELENIKVARDQQMSRISSKYQSLQASFNESLTSYNQNRSQLEEDLENLRSHNEQLLETNQETESKLQEMAKRCRVLEEELLRLQRNGADGTSSSTSTTEKVKKKYVVEMEDDVLTVSTVSVTGDEPEQGGQEEEAMQYSPQAQSAELNAPQMPSLVRRSTDPELIKLKDKTWEREYHVLQDKYMALLKEHDKVWQRVRQSPLHRGPIDLEGELTIEVTDSSVIELIEENSRLHALSTKLENELMSQRIDCLEVDAAYTELTWLREQKVKLEEKLRLQYQMFDQEKRVLEQRLNELQVSLEKVISMKRRTSEEVLTLKNKYSDLLAVSSDEVKELAEQVSSEEDRIKLVSKVAETERLSELETQVKHERDEKEFLQVQVAHLKKECELYERHVRDLEKEIDEQYTHLHEASREHKTMVQLLAETKLELELNREKHHQVTKIGQTVERIEAQLSGRSTPQSALLCSPPAVTSGACSPTQQPYIDSRPSTSCDSTEETQHIAETSRIVDEMVQLRHEIMEAKSMYSREKSLFRHTQQHKSSPGDQTAIKEELAVIEEQNILLKRENEDLQKRLSEQEELVFHLQARLSSDSTDDGKDTLEAVFKQQLVLFRSERDALQEKVHVLEQHTQESRDLLREKTIMEETFNQEREGLKQKLQEKELNKMELIHKITALEKHIREQQRLEELIYHKSSLEDEIRRQKESFDHELVDVEKTLQDRRNMIKIERVKLLGELKQRHWQKILNVDDCEGAESSNQAGHKPKSMASGFERLSRMKGEVEQRYREAIDRLRHELHADSHYLTQRSGHH